MLFPVENFPVHWVDGMKISKDHFVDSDNYVTDLVRDASSAFITPLMYGLLASPVHSKSLELQAISTSPNSITVTLELCHAITIGGFKISVDKRQSSHTDLTTELHINNDLYVNNESGSYDIVLMADPYHRKPIGIPSVEEMPPRHPYTDAHYKLFIVPAEQISNSELGPYYFIVGKIQYKDNRLNLLETFIPACTSIRSHEDLMFFHSYCVQAIQRIQQLSLNIVRKIHEKSRASDISKHFQTLCQALLSYISFIHFDLINEMPEQSPVKLVGCISTMAYMHHTALQCTPPKEREDLQQYLFEWTDITPTEFEQILTSIISLKYVHGDVYGSLKSARAYLEATETIWNKMQMLEFIGQRKENMVVMKETIQTKVEVSKKRWSILD